MPARPQQPRVQTDHPLWVRGIKVPTGPPAVRSYTFYEPRSGLGVRNWANLYENNTVTVDGGVLTAAIERVPTIDGCPGVPLNGSSQYVRFGSYAGIDVAATAFTGWARFILRTEPANGVYSSPWGQWNEPSNSANNQTFTLILANNVLGYPQHSFLVYIQKVGGVLVNVGTQYAASDVGQVWTMAATGDGATLHVWLMVGPRVYHASTAYTGQVSGSNAGEVVSGRIDGQYLDMIALGAGVIRERALGLPELLQLHRDPWGLVTPRRSVVAVAVGGGSQQVNYSNDTTADYWMVLDTPWEFETDTSNAGSEFVDEDLILETETELLAYVGGSLTAEPEASFPLEFETVTVAGQQAFFSGPQSVSYANFTAVATTASVVDIAEYETVTGARVRVQLRPDGRTDLLDDRRYRR